LKDTVHKYCTVPNLLKVAKKKWIAMSFAVESALRMTKEALLLLHVHARVLANGYVVKILVLFP
jgi:hypothetical protein